MLDGDELEQTGDQTERQSAGAGIGNTEQPNIRLITSQL